MVYQLRLPIVELLSDHEIKFHSGGSLSEAVLMSLLAPLVGVGFGFAFYASLGVVVGVVAGVVFLGGMALLARASYCTPLHYIFNVKTGVVTRCSLMGSRSSASIDASSISSSKCLTADSRGYYWVLSMNFDGEEVLLSRHNDSKLTVSTIEFFINLLNESLKVNNAKQAYDSMAEGIAPLKDIFKEFHSAPMWKTVFGGFYTVLLYLFAIAFILAVGGMVCALIYTVVTS